ncbi:MAG: hypothetical protein OEN50_01405 [Deltaproteobacteria bacterium]|nr:hypothetical protein [Deltaproteobacteria bacterium]
MKTFLTAAIVLFLVGTAGAADYFMYRDGGGKTVLSNIAPAATARIMARHDLTDATAAEIAATETANRETARLNALRDISNSYDRLAEAIILAHMPRPIFVEHNQVAVSVGQPRLRSGRGHFGHVGY